MNTFQKEIIKIMKYINTRLVLVFFLFTSLFVITGFNSSIAQPTHSDCLNCIPICDTVYTELNTYSGTGTIVDVNPAFTCPTLHGEVNSSWYTFTTQVGGTIEFTLTPANPAANFNWELYDITGTSCSAIHSNAALKIACNHDPSNGTTWCGCGGSGPRWCTPPTVAINRTLVLCVDNMIPTAGGFTLNFHCSSAQIIDHVPPHMSSVNQPVNCNTTTIKVHFSENIACLDSADFHCFYITDIVPNIYHITNITSTNCNTNLAPYDNYFTFTCSPPLPHSGFYTFHDTCGVKDLCGNIASNGTLQFQIAGVNAVLRHADAGCTCNGR